MVKDREILKKMISEYTDKDLTVIFYGSIQMDFIIESAQMLMSNNTLMITNGEKKN